MAGRLQTRFSKAFKLTVPIASAPMAFAAPPALAQAVSKAGGLGFIGGGYGLEHDIPEAFAAVADTQVGIGFITWSLARRPELLTQALACKPKAIMLSFGDPAPFARQVREAGVALFCQCQTMKQVRDALAAGADVIVAQGTEAGGHGAARGTMSFVAEVADLLSATSPTTLLLAAGGIADGRGVAAALMLGADGVLMGSRFWASQESHVKASLVDAALAADGDATVRSSVPDVARKLSWPAPFNIRTLNTPIIDEWRGKEEYARSDPLKGEELCLRFAQGTVSGDPDNTAVVVGEAIGLIRDRPSAGDLLARIAAEAVERLSAASTYIDGPISSAGPRSSL
eukprot:TRINITY_DN17595_c0_g1_i1.p1 TRINITY_DN17595_c0_g1~~TRINITY_DN17595_c0_g1_i1.p1  ORF type:complete len:342 (+),score=50.61 TRINITY_DN17595_c0_g1_i1:122-1147(+)